MALRQLWALQLPARQATWQRWPAEEARMALLLLQEQQQLVLQPLLLPVVSQLRVQRAAWQRWQAPVEAAQR